MWSPWFLTLFVLTVVARGSLTSSPVGGTFDGPTIDIPEGFLIGAGSSAFQIEGSEDADGKGPSVLSYLDTKGAADSYRRYKEDVKAIKDLKLQAYRFSVSWPRVLPDGNIKKPNQAGVNYYNNLINELIENGIQPMITMLHYDVPLEVKEKTGGWTDRRMVDAFAEYGDFLFENFGDRVKLWTTVNEPNFYCMSSSIGGGGESPGDDYKCVHHVALAHMKTYRIYEKKYKATQHGKVGTAALALWASPNTTSYDDIQAAERKNLFMLGIMYHPVVFGDYPPAIRERVDHYSRLEGRNESRLPHFTENEKQQLLGATDFLCFNAYNGHKVADSTYEPHPAAGTMLSDMDSVEIGTDSTPGNFGIQLMMADPKVLREAPLWIHQNYKMPIMITENGWADQRGGSGDNDPRHDSPRAPYHSVYLQELLRVLREDDVNVLGYMVWSLLDSYEWSAVFSRKFGLVYVDYETGSLNRTLKDSSWFFQYIGEHRKVPVLEFNFDFSSGATRTLPAITFTMIVTTTALWWT